MSKELKLEGEAAKRTIYILQGKYDGEWEDLTAADSLAEIGEYYLNYKDNEPSTPLRVQIEWPSGQRYVTKEIGSIK